MVVIENLISGLLDESFKGRIPHQGGCAVNNLNLEFRLCITVIQMIELPVLLITNLNLLMGSLGVLYLDFKRFILHVTVTE